VIAVALALLAAAAPGDGSVALKAGTVHLVEDGQVLTGGATVVVRNGVIVAAGKDVAAPPGAQVVDYGPDAVIVPGLVAAASSYGVGFSSQRTADPTVRAIDTFDVYSDGYVVDLMGGVTTAYVAPSRNRLFGGQGAVVRLGGEERERVLDDSASIHGTITAAARSVPSYWEPPVPATVDVGLGVAQQQLPGSAMGAILALDELIALARGRAQDTGEYGQLTTATLRELMQRETPWRIGADSVEEIRALLAWAQRERIPLVIEGGDSSGDLADEIARAGVPVIVTVDVGGESGGRDRGKLEDTRWPRYDNATRLAAAGVELAITGEGGLRPRDLRFAAGVASRGGLSEAAALRAITLGAAKVLGVDDRVGSIAPGKDGDLCVLTGSPLDPTASVLATWVRGELAWKTPATRTVVIEADELHLGDGEVLRPGQVSIRDGRIVEVGARVSHPLGARVVRGPVAMPGMIDALGFLGLEGAQRAPQTDFKLARIAAPGDDVDRRVARSGVTTVVLAPRNTSESGVPLMAYKPAASDSGSMVISDPTALRVKWTEENRLKSGERVRELLAKATEYAKKWSDYEEAIKKWTPPAEPPEAKEDKAGEDGKDEKTGEEKKDDKAGEDKKDDKKDEKKDDKKKKEKDEEEADPVTGIWIGEVTLPPFEEPARLRLRLALAGTRVTGSLRCDQVSASLVQLVGTWTDKKIACAGLGTRGFVHLGGLAKGGKLEGQLRVGKSSVDFTAARESPEAPVAELPELRRTKKEDVKEPKGKPREPGIDDKLEPFRRAMKGQGAIVVNVDREDEILACVKAFEDAGIRPVLYGAEDAWRVAGELRGRVAGVLLAPRVLEVEEGKGWNDQRNRFSELAAAGIPIAFHSAAEEGAAELPLLASYAVSLGLSPDAALRALTGDAARMMGISARVGRLTPGLDGDVVLLDGPPLAPSSSVLRAFVNGDEVR
jgi:imidazolonepropionase-like amidohydrolase